MRGQLYGIAFRATTNHDDAEDIVQQTGLDVWAYGMRYASYGGLRRLIYKALWTNLYDYWRDRSERIRHEWHLPQGFDAAHDHVTFEDAIDAGLADLKADDRELLSLSAMGLSCEEIGQLVEMSSSWVSKRLIEVRAALKEERPALRRRAERTAMRPSDNDALA